jgi:multidrug efflux pump subunit AcrA (membrane-fusion protein)
MFALTLVALVSAVCLVIASRFFVGRQTDNDTPELLTTTVWKGPYDFAVTTRGTIESASNIELRCDVRARGGGVAILDVVPEGTEVKEGDVVVDLDPSSLLEEEEQQKILISTRQSLVAEAENALKAAQIAKTEYLEGLFVSQEKLLMSELFLAERAKATAEAGLESSKALYKRAIITASQVEAAHVALDDASNKLAAVQANLNTLRSLTKQKEQTLLEATIASGEANLKSQQRNLQLEQQRLTNIQKQIANCTIRATAAGQVVYANDPDIFRSSSYTPFIVAPGAIVRERQVLIWLPNADDMQVRTTVNEARVTLIRPGMPVSIRIEALEDEVLEGEVTKVNQFAEPAGYWNSINKYGMTIRIKNPPSVLRVGMNAEAWVHVEQSSHALQLPVQALAESHGHFYSLVKSGDEYETREIEIGSTNDQVATIERGLEEGDEVVINPRAAGNLLKLPSLADSATIAVGD